MTVAKQFPANWILKLFGLNILRSLPKTLERNQFIMILTDGYSELNRAIQKSRETLLHAVSIVFGYLDYSCSVSAYLIPDNSTQIVSNFMGLSWNRALPDICVLNTYKWLSETIHTDDYRQTMKLRYSSPA